MTPVKPNNDGATGEETLPSTTDRLISDLDDNFQVVDQALETVCGEINAIPSDDPPNLSPQTTLTPPPEASMAPKTTTPRRKNVGKRSPKNESPTDDTNKPAPKRQPPVQQHQPPQRQQPPRRQQPPQRHQQKQRQTKQQPNTVKDGADPSLAKLKGRQGNQRA